MQKVGAFCILNILRMNQCLKKNLASYSHRAATTTYPCYIPVLGDSVGAGRIRLARGANVGHGFDM